LSVVKPFDARATWGTLTLFVAHHQHSADRCPAVGSSGPWFRTHLSAANAGRHGVAIQAEAVIVGQHRVILTVEASNRESVEAFMAFFSQYGETQVLEAATARDAVAHGYCAGRGNDNKPLT
jgi:hypothetical protein